VITLYTFGPHFGQPDASPFVVKAMLLLKFAGLPYREDSTGFTKAPKGKLPYIDDDGEIVADSTFIRFHIEKKYGFDFDTGLTPEQRAVAWAAEKMCEDHLYFVCMHDRWGDRANFNKGPGTFFERVPAAMRPFIRTFIRSRVLKRIKDQGLGRHSRQEIAELGIRDVDALAAILGDHSYLMGNQPCGADATVYAFVAGLLSPLFESGVRTAAERHVNLIAYVKRITERYFEMPKAG
jgi:glutathione S-transferase